MPRSHPPYPPEFRQQMVELVRAGRTPNELAQEFETTAESIRNWVKQAEITSLRSGQADEGQRSDGLTTDEKQELARLRGENKQLNPSWLPRIRYSRPLSDGTKLSIFSFYNACLRTFWTSHLGPIPSTFIL